MELRLLSYNIHKGWSALGQRLMVHRLAQALQQLGVDVMCLQEVQGEHQRHARRHPEWPSLPQHQWLAGELHAVYGRNALHRLGHHGNAVLSRWPLAHWSNTDLSLSRFERRGLLSARIHWPETEVDLYVLCTHLNLLGRHRYRQVEAVMHWVEQHVPAQAALILAGDFNDWRQQLSPVLAQGLGMLEVFESLHGRPQPSFPARWPLLALDRIYVRGLTPVQAQVLNHGVWPSLSDHLPLLVRLRLDALTEGHHAG